jgi:hypothetical protein
MKKAGILASRFLLPASCFGNLPSNDGSVGIWQLKLSRRNSTLIRLREWNRASEKHDNSPQRHGEHGERFFDDKRFGGRKERSGVEVFPKKDNRRAILSVTNMEFLEILSGRSG